MIDPKKNINKEIKLIPEMLNLLGCNKENFIKLMEKMNYKSLLKGKEIYFKYLSNKRYKKITTTKLVNKDNPFSVLKEIRIK